MQPTAASQHRGRVRRQARGPRRGAVAVEMLVNLPIWLIGLLAVIEFGQLFVNLQQVALASRVGVEKASQLSPISDNNNDPVPQPVLEAVEHQLLSSGISWCKVILEHNVGGAPVTLVSGNCTCPAPGTPLPSLGTYVRVTVCVPVTEITPNLLNPFGLNASSWHVRQSATFRYEL